jgi:drug/metabolite transporter (DMT)-like permease
LTAVADLLALLAAVCFALAATLQQKGALGLGDVSLAHPKSLLRLAGERMWLYGTAALLVGYVFQAAALDRGRLSVVQPLLVTTIVFALPLGYFLTGQHVGSREVVGAIVVVLGLVLFTVVGDPAGGRDNAPGWEWAIVAVVVGGLSVGLVLLGGSGTLARKAGLYGAAAGMLYGLSASLCKPTMEILDANNVGTMLTSWEFYAFALAGIAAFVVQQVSLGTGRLAPSVATTSVMNPVVSVIVGILLLEETLSEPTWHKVLAWVGLGLALWGAIAISLAREPDGEVDPSTPGEAPGATVPA